jgi:hypothetical protein
LKLLEVLMPYNPLPPIYIWYDTQSLGNLCRAIRRTRAGLSAVLFALTMCSAALLLLAACGSQPTPIAVQPTATPAATTIPVPATTPSLRPTASPAPIRAEPGSHPRIAFTARRDGKRNIYTSYAHGSGLLQITERREMQWQP